MIIDAYNATSAPSSESIAAAKEVAVFSSTATGSESSLCATGTASTSTAIDANDIVETETEFIRSGHGSISFETLLLVVKLPAGMELI